jgi:hypothetical protein
MISENWSDLSNEYARASKQRCYAGQYRETYGIYVYANGQF